MPLRRLALISVHASPIAPMGGKKTGGMNIYIRKVAEEFARRGVQVDIFTRRTAADMPAVEQLSENLRVVNVTAGMQWPLAPDDIYPHLPEFTAGVIAFATRHNVVYDLVYSHYWLSGWVASKLHEIWGTPFVQMFHTLGHMKNRVISTDSDTTPNQRIRVETDVARDADRVIAATPAEYAQLRWLYRVNRRKIGIISPGVDIEQFHTMSVDEARREIGMALDAKVLLFAGRIEPIKAIDTLIRALPIIQAQNPDLYANLYTMIVGGDPSDVLDEEMTRLQALARDLHVEEHVRFVAAKEHNALLPYYAAASALVMPSIYESFGMVALEAMATGTPVIASAVGGLTYLVKDGETGYLVPSREADALADRIVMLLTLPPESYMAMRTSAVACARHFTWTFIVDELQAAFEEILTNSCPNRHKN